MIRTLIAVAVAGAFALPLTSAANDNIVVAQGGAGDTGASSRQEGVNPPGQASPGTPRSATTGIDRQTGTARATSNRGRFEALDKNHDGYVSRDEAKDAAELNTRFTELDANNDGKLSHDEYSAVNSSARGATGTGSTSGRAGAPMGAGGSSK